MSNRISPLIGVLCIVLSLAFLFLKFPFCLILAFICLISGVIILLLNKKIRKIAKIAAISITIFLLPISLFKLSQTFVGIKQRGLFYACSFCNHKGDSFPCGFSCSYVMDLLAWSILCLLSIIVLVLSLKNKRSLTKKSSGLNEPPPVR